MTEKFRPYLTYFRTSAIDIRVLDPKPMITTLDGECSPQKTLHAETARRSARILAAKTRTQRTCSAGHGRVSNV